MLNPAPVRETDRRTAEPLAAAKATPPRKPGPGDVVRRWLLRVIPFVLLIAAGWVLWREFHTLSIREVGSAMGQWGGGRIALALCLSALSFLLMGCVEKLGLGWAGARVPLPSVLGGSFVANGIAHTVGANLLVSGAVRARLYHRYGVSLTQVAGTTLFCGTAFAVGISTLGGAGMLLSAPEQIAATAIPLPVARTLGAVLIGWVVCYVLLCAFRRRKPLHAFGRTLTLPRVRDALGQVAIGVTDNATAAAIIWILLPPDTVHYHTFVGAYAVATVAGLASTVPAGAGVFEGTMSTLLRTVNPAPLAAAFLGYRLAFFILPLIVAGAALFLDTLLRRSSRRR
ncbi:lysylphosphatidylglycerol synthase transmembrane domain-containing protein [Phenylobacterium deserti]|uniref:Uncharacterized protein n=1 Tax=Phenylobacterium deserti TaxID=1914756 RepID=A0A328AE53_9CAUL|nr:YbhN family protein [Phenylobacterium deserti]RAK52911.1 hypothetical protein DJ018_12100 [Phenylobacterium deserti]